MSSGFDNSISNLTGISRGRFGKLHILRAGTFQDINSVVDGIASSVDLSDYYTEAEVDADIQLETDATLQRFSSFLFLFSVSWF